MNILNTINGFLDKIFGVIEPYFLALTTIFLKIFLISILAILAFLIILLIYYCIMACITKIRIKAKDDYKIDVKEWEGGK